MATFNPRRIVQIGICALLACSSLLVADASPIPSSSSSPSSSPSTSTGQVLPVSSSDQAQFQLWVKYAGAAYCNVDNWSCGATCRGPTAGTQLIKFFNTTANKGYVAVNHDQKAIIVAFRGSADEASFLTDAKFEFADFPGVPGAQVHAGFLDAFNSTRNEINPIIASAIAQNPDHQVILTGHSLGGAMAVLQMIDLVGTSGLTPDNLFTYTYGQPRIGNQKFAEFLRQKTDGFKIFRLVNDADLVPHVPPTGLNYVHEGPEFWVRNTTMTECTEAEDNRCSNSLGVNFNMLEHINYLNTPFLVSCLAP